MFIGESARLVLDIGGGMGQTVLALAERWPGLRGIVMDPNPVARKLARIATQPNDRIRIVNGNAECLGFRDSIFDGILCRNVLSFTDSHRALSEMARCLAPGGRLFLKVMGWRFSWPRLRTAMVRIKLKSLALYGFPLLNGILQSATGRSIGLPWKGQRHREHFIGPRSIVRFANSSKLELLFEDFSAGSATPTDILEKTR